MNHWFDWVNFIIQVHTRLTILIKCYPCNPWAMIATLVTKWWAW